jgi:hypothetical protein
VAFCGSASGVTIVWTFDKGPLQQTINAPKMNLPKNNNDAEKQKKQSKANKLNADNTNRRNQTASCEGTGWGKR